jgi:hypothetical protein
MKNTYIAIIALFITSSMSLAQIPNAGFENWTSMGSYNIPDSWSCLNTMTSPLSVYTCSRGTPGHPGASYLKLDSKTVSGMGVVPGIAVCGTIDEMTMQATGGFPFNQRPASLDGSWQHMVMGMGSSQGYVDIVLTRWDNMMQMRMPVASAHEELTGMAMSWETFSIPLNYVDFNFPDSCIITLSASGNNPMNNDFLYVDDLSFVGSVSGIREISAGGFIRLYPNPVKSIVKIEISEINVRNTHICVYDALGEIVKEAEGSGDDLNSGIDVSSLAEGLYFLNLVADGKSYGARFLVQ